MIETLLGPEKVVRSLSDASVSLYYTYREETLMGAKWLCVVVKNLEEVSFILTAYLTEKVKKGEEIWPGK